MVLIYISALTNDVEHHFHVLVGHLYILRKVIYSDFLPHFWIGLFASWLLNCKSSSYIQYARPLSAFMMYRYFLTFCRSSFHFLDHALFCTKVVKCYEIQFVWFCFSCLAYAFGVISRNPLPNLGLWRFTCMFSPKSFMVLALILGHSLFFKFLFIIQWIYYIYGCTVIFTIQFYRIYIPHL